MRKWKDSSILVGLLVFIVMLTTGAAFVERGDKYFLDKVTIKGVTTIHDFLTLAKAPKTTYGNGAIAASSVGTVTEYGDGVLHESDITISSTISTLDSTGVGAWGSLKLYDFPAGAIKIVGTTVNLTATSAGGAAGIVAAADGDFSLGTAACNPGSLSSTEADIIASTALTQFVTTTGVIKGQSTADSFHDGTSTAKDLYLNVIFDDADSSAADTLTVAGSVKVFWINLGDY